VPFAGGFAFAHYTARVRRATKKATSKLGCYS
jgi:hypothetical protein